MEEPMKKFTAVFAAIFIALSLCASVHGAGFYDTDGHWAQNSIEYMVKKGVLSGYTDGTFRPDDTVTRAEFVKMTVGTFGLGGSMWYGGSAVLEYDDVSESDWFYPYISCAKAQGFLLDYGRKFGPDTKLTREEAVTLISRYLALPEEYDDGSASYTDANTIPINYRTHVMRASRAGLISGYPDNTFRPRETLTRAEALTILCRAAGTIYDGKYTVGSFEAKNAVVTASDQTVENIDIDGDLYITEGAAAGILRLENCTIGGTLYLRGNVTLTMSNCDIERFESDMTYGEKATLHLHDNTVIGHLEAETRTLLNISQNSRVYELTVNESAEQTIVWGEGHIDNAEVYGDMFSSKIVPLTYSVADGLTAYIGEIEEPKHDNIRLPAVTPIISGIREIPPGDEPSRLAGFFTQPKVRRESDFGYPNDYYSFSTLEDGTVYFEYFTSSPEKVNFTMDFEVEAYKGYNCNTSGELFRSQLMVAAYYSNNVMIRFVNDNGFTYGPYMLEVTGDSIVMPEEALIPKNKPELPPGTMPSEFAGFYAHPTVRRDLKTDPIFCDRYTIMTTEKGTVYFDYIDSESGKTLHTEKFVVPAYGYMDMISSLDGTRMYNITLVADKLTVRLEADSGMIYGPYTIDVVNP